MSFSSKHLLEGNTLQDTFSIIDNNEHFIVIDKRPGINFHSENGQAGIVVLVEQALKCKIYSVHRLDKMTSGLLIFAKNSQVAKELSELFSKQLIDKYYLALSDKKPKKSQGLIKGGMEKSRRSMWRLTRSTNNLALTQFFSFGLGNGKRLFVVKPKTGKTHQIRVALKSVGSAICGDQIYATESSSQFDRGYLHAYQIQFNFRDDFYSYKSLPSVGSLFIETACQDKLLSIAEPSKLSWPKI